MNLSEAIQSQKLTHEVPELLKHGPEGLSGQIQKVESYVKAYQQLLIIRSTGDFVSLNELLADPATRRKLEKTLFKKMGALTFFDPKAAPERKREAVDSGIGYFEQHWSQKLMALVSNQWRGRYEALLRREAERGSHPAEETDPEVVIGVVNAFVAIFEKAPKSKRAYLATNSLFEAARPLHYICLTGNRKALALISPYLRRVDWLHLGPYYNTLVHCIISGMGKNFSTGAEPAGCMEKLLKTIPELRTMPNGFGMSPQPYLRLVIHNLKERNQLEMELLRQATEIERLLT